MADMDEAPQLYERRVSVIRRAEVIASAPRRWEEQYRSYEGPGQEQKHEITRILHSLSPLTAEAINAVIGNPSWTRLECSVCNRTVEAVVDFDISERTLQVCTECLSAALAMLLPAQAGEAGTGETRAAGLDAQRDHAVAEGDAP